MLYFLKNEFNQKFFKKDIIFFILYLVRVLLKKLWINHTYRTTKSVVNFCLRVLSKIFTVEMSICLLEYIVHSSAGVHCPLVRWLIVFPGGEYTVQTSSSTTPGPEKVLTKKGLQVYYWVGFYPRYRSQILTPWRTDVFPSAVLWLDLKVLMYHLQISFHAKADNSISPQWNLMLC